MNNIKKDKQRSREKTSQASSLEFACYFLFAVGPLVANAILVLLGNLSSDFMTNPTAILIAIPSFMFPFAFLQLLSGAISDVYGRVPVILCGSATFAVGLFLSALSNSLEIFIIANFVSGIAFGFINPVLLALLSDYAIPRDIPKRMGIASALASLSVGLGPFIAGQIALLNWRIYYLLFLVLVIITMIVFAISNNPLRKVRNDSGVHLLIANMSVELRRPVVLLILLTTFLIAVSYLGTLVWTSRGLAGAFDETLIGTLLLGNGISGAIAGSLLGFMRRRFGYKLPILLGFLALLTGLSIFVVVGDITLFSSIPFVLLGLIIIGFAGGFLYPSMITISQIISPERRGALAGIVTFAFFLGSALNPMIYESLFILGMNWVYSGIFIVSFILLIFLILLIRKMES